MKVEQEIALEVGGAELGAFLHIPEGAKGIVLFAHGSGSSRHSPRNQFVARYLHEAQVATLLLDLLTPEEDSQDSRFDIPFLTGRLLGATDWINSHPETHSLVIGYFGASTGAAAALVGASQKKELIRAVVSRGGRPDLAGTSLTGVVAPTLLIVGGADSVVLELNKKAYELLSCEKKLEIVPGATHLFEEPGTLEEVGRMASLWFSQYL